MKHIPRSTILEIFKNSEKEKESKGWDVSNMILKYTWRGPKKLYYKDLKKFKLWSDPNETPENTSYFLTNGYKEFTAGDMAKNYHKNKERIRKVDPGFVNEIDSLVESLKRKKNVNPILLLNKPYEKNNRQLIDGSP